TAGRSQEAMRQTGGKTTTAMLKFGPLSPNCRQRAMETVSPDDITRWLRAWSRGDGSALEKLTPLVYAELRQRARRLTARERIGHSLQPTALIHEAYLRLVGAAPVDWRDRGHFYALSARLMRQSLADARRVRA